jgi:hypothetical protein
MRVCEVLRTSGGGSRRVSGRSPVLGEARGVTCERVPSARARTNRYWPVVGRDADSMGVFTTRGAEGGEPLPIFGIGEEALLRQVHGSTPEHEAGRLRAHPRRCSDRWRCRSPPPSVAGTLDALPLRGPGATRRATPKPTCLSSPHPAKGTQPRQGESYAALNEETGEAHDLHNNGGPRGTQLRTSGNTRASS